MSIDRFPTEPNLITIKTPPFEEVRQNSIRPYHMASREVAGVNENYRKLEDRGLLEGDDPSVELAMGLLSEQQEDAFAKLQEARDDYDADCDVDWQTYTEERAGYEAMLKELYEEADQERQKLLRTVPVAIKKLAALPPLEVDEELKGDIEAELAALDAKYAHLLAPWTVPDYHLISTESSEEEVAAQVEVEEVESVSSEDLDEVHSDSEPTAGPLSPEKVAVNSLKSAAESGLKNPYATLEMVHFMENKPGRFFSVDEIAAAMYGENTPQGMAPTERTRTSKDRIHALAGSMRRGNTPRIVKDYLTRRGLVFDWREVEYPDNRGGWKPKEYRVVAIHDVTLEREEAPELPVNHREESTPKLSTERHDIPVSKPPAKRRGVPEPHRVVAPKTKKAKNTVEYPQLTPFQQALHDAEALLPAMVESGVHPDDRYSPEDLEKRLPGAIMTKESVGLSSNERSDGRTLSVVDVIVLHVLPNHWHIMNESGGVQKLMKAVADKYTQCWNRKMQKPLRETKR